MDSQKRARLILAAQHLVALAEGRRFQYYYNGKWVEPTDSVPMSFHLLENPDRWRVAEPRFNGVVPGVTPGVQAEPDKCAWCGVDKIFHTAGEKFESCPFGFIPLSLAGPRPEPPEGCELLVPAMPYIDNCDMWFDEVGNEWFLSANEANRPHWRARRKAEPRVTDHEMLVAVLRCYDGISGDEYACIRRRFLAQEGGKNV